MKFIRFLFLIPFFFVFISCSEKEPQSFEDRITHLNEQNQYEEALTELRESDKDDEVVNRMLIQTHLSYGSYLTHEANHLAMNERMSEALRHFRRVLELDEDNIHAQTHIDLIEGIYNQMGREIPEGVAK